MLLRNMLVIFIAGILWSGIVALQRPPPRYSQQFMPDTSFTCRNKIVGSYYADPETDCQVFHVCVSVAGSVQDYKFLCPNDTAFDQESQTCADWYDVDCEAATLYYASDNFDLYRLGSGLESLHYDSIRTDAEPQDHLQRSETNDPVRSAANNFNQLTQNNYNAQSNSNSNYNTNNKNNNNNNNNNRDILRGSSSSNFYNSRNNGKDEDYDNEKPYKDEPVEPRKKTGVRKVARKHQLNSNNNNNFNNINNENSYVSSSTAAPSSTITYNNGNYNNNFNSYNSRRTTYEPTTTIRSTSQQDYNKYNKDYNNNNQKYSTPITSTYRPTTVQQQNYQSSSTTIRPSPFISNKNYNNNNYQSNIAQSSTTVKPPVSFSQNLHHTPTTSRPTTYNHNYQEFFNNHQYNMQYTNNNARPQQQSTTIVPNTNYQQNDYSNNQQRNYNNIQRSTSTIGVSSTTSASTHNDNYNGNTNNNYNNQNNVRSSSATVSGRQVSTQTTKFYPNYSASSYVPTTYSPLIVKKTTNGNSDNNGQYYDKSSQQIKSTQYYDSTKAPKKATQNINYDNTNTGKYFETSTINYDFARSQAAIGFSPSSINLLAESPRTTTPVPRRTGSPTTYNPNNYNHRVTHQQQQHQPQQQQSTTSRSSTLGSAKSFSTNAVFTDITSPKPKSTKKNDYDYAYYDNAGGLEYDGLDLDHVARNKESSKISRN